MTLQSLVVLAIGMCFGPRLGAASVALYLCKRNIVDGPLERACDAAYDPPPSPPARSKAPISAIAPTSPRHRRSARTGEGARRFAENVAPVIQQIRASGIVSLRGVAGALNARAALAARGGRRVATQVVAVVARARARSATNPSRS